MGAGCVGVGGEKCGCLGGRWFREGGIRSTKFQKKIRITSAEFNQKNPFFES